MPVWQSCSTMITSSLLAQKCSTSGGGNSLYPLFSSLRRGIWYLWEVYQWPWSTSVIGLCMWAIRVHVDSTHISYECCLFFLQGYVRYEMDQDRNWCWFSCIIMQKIFQALLAVSQLFIGGMPICFICSISRLIYIPFSKSIFTHICALRPKSSHPRGTARHLSDRNCGSRRAYRLYPADSFSNVDLFQWSTEAPSTGVSTVNGCVNLFTSDKWALNDCVHWALADRVCY